MPRAATTSDVFNAIAEPRRRAIVDLLAFGTELDVSALVLRLGLPQPTVSKHLGVLRKVGLVAVEKAGPRRVYRLRPERLRPVRDWVASFDRFWTDHLSDLRHAAERAARTGPDQTPFAKEQTDDR